MFTETATKANDNKKNGSIELQYEVGIFRLE